ncbi:MAG TPA: dephospho-CoA kinase, partial [Gammaproteobacteria bacterium]|nr:dephospho-CoA kinase [Gammaproteobacteria bacterium]
MKVYGLTGGIGSGKTTAANFFAELGIPVIDADQISKEITQPNTPTTQDIIKHFGDEVCVNHTLDRNKLRQIIFNNPAEKKWLEQLLHPL